MHGAERPFFYMFKVLRIALITSSTILKKIGRLAAYPINSFMSTS